MVEEEKEELGDAIKEFNRGLDSHIEGNLDRALKHLKAALPTFQEFGVEQMIAGTFHEMGMIYQEQGEYDTALDNYQKSLQLSTQKNYLPGCAKTYHQMATLSEEKGDVIQAQEWYKKAEECRTHKPPGLKFIIFSFIGTGIWGISSGLLGIAANNGFVPQFIPADLWAYMETFLTNFGSFLVVLGVFALLAGIGMHRLNGWGWVMGILTSLLTVIAISGILFYWYLSKENIQELYDVKY